MKIFFAVMASVKVVQARFFLFCNEDECHEKMVLASIEKTGYMPSLQENKSGSMLYETTALM